MQDAADKDLMTKANFKLAVNRVLEHEGGYTNDTKDPGGETNFGITQSDLNEYGQQLGLITTIKNLTLMDAIMIYRHAYWDKYDYDLIDSVTLSAKLFDSAVNIGQETAVKLIQKIISLMSIASLQPDGLLGINTANACNKATATGLENTLLEHFREELCNHYQELVIKNPNLKKFLKGWLIRAES